MATNQFFHNYSSFIELNISLLGKKIVTITKPGYANWNHVSPASKLIAEYVALQPGSRALHLNSGNGVSSAFLARKFADTDFQLMDTNIVAIESAKKTIRANQIQNARVIPWSESDLQTSAFDVVILEILKGRKVTRRRILEAFAALKPGGKFYLSGANRAGVRSAVEDARSVFGNASILGYKKGNRISISTKLSPNIPHPEWTTEPGITPGSWYEFQALISGFSIKVWSIPGIFSYNKIDEGTRLLLEKLKVNPAMRILDVGCGWGCIGISAATQGAQVDMVDVDLLSVYATTQNININRLINASVYASDITGSVNDHTYDIVASNPPFHNSISIDYAVAKAIVFEAHGVLESGGELWLTANQFLPYQDFVMEYFGNFSVITTTGKYKLIRSVKN